MVLFVTVLLRAQPQEEKIYKANIRTVKLNPFGVQNVYPVMRLHSNDLIELHFDDLDGGVRNYYYTLELCNADWTPAQMSQFDFVSGFSQLRIGTYRISNSSLTRYTHYSANIPDRNMSPSRSGNYIVRVFLDGNPSKTVFTKRLLVVDAKVDAGIQVIQPFSTEYFKTHQKVQVLVNTKDLPVSMPNMQIKTVVMQNGRWDNAKYFTTPTFLRNKSLEYSNEISNLFPGGKEWRWLDLRSIRFRSDRIAGIDSKDNSSTVNMRTDEERSGKSYLYFRDDDGRYSIENIDNYNPLWQSDYATVNFSYSTPDGQPYPNKDVYIYGELTNYELSDDYKLRYDADSAVYLGSLFLKQGYYNYMYATVDKNSKKPVPDMSKTEGNYTETENEYMVLVYYRPLGGRVDELVGYMKINSLFGRRGDGIRIIN
jgi:hypothetical protein